MVSAPVSLGIVAVVAAITFLTRALPFFLFRRAERVPRFVLFLGATLPFSAMGMLVVYCLKSVSVQSWPFGLPEAIAVALVVLLHKWKHSTFLSVGLGTVCYMVLVQLVFV